MTIYTLNKAIVDILITPAAKCHKKKRVYGDGGFPLCQIFSTGWPAAWQSTCPDIFWAKHYKKGAMWAMLVNIIGHSLV